MQFKTDLLYQLSRRYVLLKQVTTNKTLILEEFLPSLIYNEIQGMSEVDLMNHFLTHSLPDVFISLLERAIGRWEVKFVTVTDTYQVPTVKLQPTLLLELANEFQGIKTISTRICDTLVLIGFGGAISNLVYFFTKLHKFKVKPFKKIYVFEPEFLDFTNFCRYWFDKTIKSSHKTIHAKKICKLIADEVFVVPMKYHFAFENYFISDNYRIITAVGPSDRAELAKRYGNKLFFAGHYDDEAVFTNIHNPSTLFLANETYGKIRVDVLKYHLSYFAYHLPDYLTSDSIRVDRKCDLQTITTQDILWIH